MPMLAADVTPPAMVSPAQSPATDRKWIEPGAIWPDDRGQHIQAHGGGILKEGDTYFWFGEYRAQDNEKGKCYVGCYSSTDLINWKFRNKVVASESPFADKSLWWTLERPKVYHNKKTGKYVMWVHIEGGEKKGYARGEIAIYVSDTVDGNYEFVKTFRPLGQESRDIGQFVDDDGTAYLVSEARPTRGFFIYKLSDDYMDVAEETCFIKAGLEGGAIVKYDGLYYAIGSYLTGWDPNDNMYATAKSLKGPWSEFKNVAQPGKKTYGSQSTMMLKVVGTDSTTVIFMGDMWRPKQHWDGRYLWMPLQIGDGKLWLPEPKPWTIDLKTGVVTFK